MVIAAMKLLKQPCSWRGPQNPQVQRQPYYKQGTWGPPATGARPEDEASYIFHPSPSPWPPACVYKGMKEGFKLGGSKSTRFWRVGWT